MRNYQTIMETTLKCEFCGQDDFASSRGLSQHYQKSKSYSQRLSISLSNNSGYFTAQEYLACTQILDRVNDKLFLVVKSEFNAIVKEDALATQKLSAKSNSYNDIQVQEGFETAVEYFPVDDGDDSGIILQESVSSIDDISVESNNQNWMVDVINYGPSSFDILGNFHAYCEDAKNNLIPFTKLEQTAIELMSTLQKSKASLDTYNDIMEWHLKTTS